MDLKNKRIIGVSHIILCIAMLVLYTRIGGYGMIYVAGSIELFFLITGIFLGGIPDAMEYMIRIRRKREQYKDAVKVQRAGVVYGIIGAVLTEAALLAVNEWLVAPSGLIYVYQLLRLFMLAVPFYAALQVIRGLLQAELDRTFSGWSELVFAVFMIAATFCAVLLMGDYGSMAANFMQSVLLEYFYVLLGLVPGVIFGALAAIIFLTVTGFLNRDKLHIFERQSGVSKDSLAGLVWQLFTSQFMETAMQCLKRLPVVVLFWLSLEEISGENYLFGNFYVAVLPVLYIAWTVCDLGLFSYKKRLFIYYRKKQPEQYYRDLKTVLSYVLIHSTAIAGFVLAMNKSYLAIWGQQTFVSFMGLAAWSTFIGLLGLPCMVLIDILKYRNLQAQAFCSVALGVLISCICAIVGYKYWGAGVLLYVLCICVQMLITIIAASWCLSAAVGIHYLSVLIRTGGCIIITLLISLVLYGVQRLIFTALGGLATLLVCMALGMLLLFIAVLALKVFDKEELKDLPLSFITGYLTKFF